MNSKEINNCITLLDRVPIQGHKEVRVMNEVMEALLEELQLTSDEVVHPDTESS